jgi:tetratricopeptide (TPR) repeat protein
MPEAPYSLGVVLWQTRRLDEAAAMFREALSRRPEYADAHYMLGTVLKQQGDRDAALREFRETIRINPSFTEAYTSIGQVLTAARDPEAAAEAFAEAQRLNKRKADSQAAVFAVNAGRERLQKGDVRGAIARFRDAVRLAPDNAQAHYQLALALRRSGAMTEARAEYESARRLAPYLRW